MSVVLSWMEAHYREQGGMGERMCSPIDGGRLVGLFAPSSGGNT